MNRLIMTVGLPQSGKSTWARATGFPVVNPDSIRLGLHGKPFIGLAEPFVWAVAKVMVRSLFLAGHEHVVLDATNTTRQRRDDWKSRDWVREFRHFGTTVDVCKERAKQTAIDAEHLEGLLRAIDRMDEQFEHITPEELGEIAAGDT